MYSLIQFCTILILYTVSIGFIKYLNGELISMFISFRIAFFDFGQFPIFVHRFDNNSKFGIYNGPPRSIREISCKTSEQFIAIAGQYDTINFASISLCICTSCWHRVLKSTELVRLQWILFTIEILIESHLFYLIGFSRYLVKTLHCQSNRMLPILSKKHFVGKIPFYFQ